MSVIEHITLLLAVYIIFRLLLRNKNVGEIFALSFKRYLMFSFERNKKKKKREREKEKKKAPLCVMLEITKLVFCS